MTVWDKNWPWLLQGLALLVEIFDWCLAEHSTQYSTVHGLVCICIWSGGWAGSPCQDLLAVSWLPRVWARSTAALRAPLVLSSIEAVRGVTAPCAPGVGDTVTQSIFSDQEWLQKWPHVLTWGNYPRPPGHSAPLPFCVMGSDRGSSQGWAGPVGLRGFKASSASLDLSCTRSGSRYQSPRGECFAKNVEEKWIFWAKKGFKKETKIGLNMFHQEHKFCNLFCSIRLSIIISFYSLQ